MFSNIFNTSLHTNSICSKEYSGFHSWIQKQEGVCWKWTHWTLGVILRRSTWRLFTSFQMLLLRLLLAPPPRTPPLNVLSWVLIIAKQSRYSYLFEYYLYGQKHQETDFSVAASKRHAKNKPCLATCFVHFDLYGPAPSDESHPRWSRPWLAPQTSPGWSRPSLRVHGPDRPTAVPPLKTTFRFECISWKIAHPGLWLNPWRKGPKSSCEDWPARANFQILVERIITSQA